MTRLTERTEPMDAELVSVVIPVRNGARTIREQLEALAAQLYEGRWELVVADNGSVDGTILVLDAFRGRFATLRVTRANRGVGINVARNAGVRAARGGTILICDADDVVHPGWIAAHVKALEADDISGGPLDEVSLNTREVTAFNAGGEPAGRPVSGRFLPYAYGGNLGFRRTVWEAIGGFDEAWQRGATEIEFCWRAQLAGFTVGWTPQAIIAYRHDSTIQSEVKRRYRSARAVPRLYAQFQEHGMPATRLRPALRAWAWLVFRAPWAVAKREWRIKWLQVAAWRSGLVAGSLRYGTFYV